MSPACAAVVNAASSVSVFVPMAVISCTSGLTAVPLRREPSSVHSSTMSPTVNCSTSVPPPSGPRKLLLSQV